MLNAVHMVASELAASWGLRDLDGVTVADDLPAAVDAIAWHRNGVSHGIERFDRGEGAIAGIVLSVKARYRSLEHVVLDAQFLKALVDGTEMADFARNIIAHELAHVVFAPSRHDDECTPHAMDDWRTHVLLVLARPLCNEYAARRLSALIGDYKTALFNFQNILASDLRDYGAPLHNTDPASTASQGADTLRSLLPHPSYRRAWPRSNEIACPPDAPRRACTLLHRARSGAGPRAHSCAL